MNEQLEQSIQYAKKYLEDLMSFFGLNTDIYATAEDDVIELNVPSTHLNGFLIGQRGDTMRSLQFIVSSALKNNGFEFTRVNIDVADYKKQRAQRLEETAEAWISRVKNTGEPMALRPMNAADRRIIHRLAGDNDLETESKGEGRDRHVILKPGANFKPGRLDDDTGDIDDTANGTDDAPVPIEDTQEDITEEIS